MFSIFTFLQVKIQTILTKIPVTIIYIYIPTSKDSNAETATATLPSVDIYIPTSKDSNSDRKK